MKALQRPARVAAVVSAVAAVGAGTVIAVGTASAAEPAKCVENVNVREQPRIDSKVIALCEAGTTVEAGEIRNGFVRLTDLGGWSAQEYISINGQKPVKPSNSTAGALDDEEGTRTGRSASAEDEDATTTPRSSRSGSTEDADTADSTDEIEAGAPGDRSESRTNGKVDQDEEKDAAAKPKPAPAAPAKPGAGLIPGL